MSRSLKLAFVHLELLFFSQIGCFHGKYNFIEIMLMYFASGTCDIL